MRPCEATRTDEREQDVNPDGAEVQSSVSIFQTELDALLNSHNQENGSDTPDFILGEFLSRVLVSFDLAVKKRHAWWHDGKINAAAAVIGVLAWLSTQPEELKIGASNDCAVLAELADRFCKANDLGEPNDMQLVNHPVD